MKNIIMLFIFYSIFSFSSIEEDEILKKGLPIKDGYKFSTASEKIPTGSGPYSESKKIRNGNKIKINISITDPYIYSNGKEYKEVKKKINKKKEKVISFSSYESEGYYSDIECLLNGLVFVIRKENSAGLGLELYFNSMSNKIKKIRLSTFLKDNREIYNSADRKSDFYHDLAREYTFDTNGKIKEISPAFVFNIGILIGNIPIVYENPHKIVDGPKYFIRLPVFRDQMSYRKMNKSKNLEESKLFIKDNNYKIDISSKLKGKDQLVCQLQFNKKFEIKKIIAMKVDYLYEEINGGICFNFNNGKYVSKEDIKQFNEM